MKAQETIKLTSTLERAIKDIDTKLASGKVDLILDFQDVNFISVDGLEWLEELLLRGQSNSTNISFINIQPEQYKVFKVAHIDSLLQACHAPLPSVPMC